eukprot:25068-Rhodomonas_salina.4
MCYLRTAQRTAHQQDAPPVYRKQYTLCQYNTPAAHATLVPQSAQDNSSIRYASAQHTSRIRYGSTAQRTAP